MPDAGLGSEAIVESNSVPGTLILPLLVGGHMHGVPLVPQHPALRTRYQVLLITSLAKGEGLFTIFVTLLTSPSTVPVPCGASEYILGHLANLPLPTASCIKSNHLLIGVL